MRRESHSFGIRLAATAVFAVLACMPAAAKGEIKAAELVAQPALAADLVSSTEACLNYTPVRATDAEWTLASALLDADATAASRSKPCKACPDRPWCTCTYNGMPRVTCDPCCYIQFNGQQICLD